MALLQGVGLGDYYFRGKLAVGWHRPLLYCEGEVHIEGKILQQLADKLKKRNCQYPLDESVS